MIHNRFREMGLTKIVAYFLSAIGNHHLRHRHANWSVHLLLPLRSRYWEILRHWLLIFVLSLLFSLYFLFLLAFILLLYGIWLRELLCRNLLEVSLRLRRRRHSHLKVWLMSQLRRWHLIWEVVLTHVGSIVRKHWWI